MKSYNYILLLFINLCFLGCKKDKNVANNIKILSTLDTLEQHRPVYHFTPNKNWINDPNGLVYKDGEYHLFYQYHPKSNVWGPMHWGHATSKNLIDWNAKPIALYPDEKGYIFSGSAVVDKNNTSGLGTGAIVAFFTYHNFEKFTNGEKTYQSQGLAYSLDNGKTWKKYHGNPIIKNPGSKNFRDPKVFWHKASSKWIMLVAAKDHLKIYNSDNLIEWRQQSEFGKNQGMHQKGVWECPDLFKLSVNETGEEKWVLLQNINEENPNGGSGTQYFIGAFDGVTFKNDNTPETVLWMDYGKDNFAGITWNNIPDTDGRRIFIGWMSNWQYAQKVPTKKWRNGMTFPRTFELKNTLKGLRLISKPIQEINQIRKTSKTFENIKITKSVDISEKLPFKIKASEIIIDFNALEDIKLSFSNDLNEELVVGYLKDENQIFIDRSKSGKTSFAEEFSKTQRAPRISNHSNLKLHILLDVASIEVFVDDGEVTMTSLFFPNKDFTNFKISSNKATTRSTIKKIEVHQLSLTKNKNQTKK